MICFVDDPFWNWLFRRQYILWHDLFYGRIHIVTNTDPRYRATSKLTPPTLTPNFLRTYTVLENKNKNTYLQTRLANFFNFIQGIKNWCFDTNILTSSFTSKFKLRCHPTASPLTDNPKAELRHDMICSPAWCQSTFQSFSGPAPDRTASDGSSVRSSHSLFLSGPKSGCPSTPVPKTARLDLVKAIGPCYLTVFPYRGPSSIRLMYRQESILAIVVLPSQKKIMYNELAYC